MFGVNEITCYQSYDGEIFKTREEAEAHNKESFENVIPFDEFYMYDENGNIIIQADGSIPNYDDVCFFYAKTDRGAEFLKKYLSEYYDDERLENTLNTLLKLNKQIIIMTCSDREKNILDKLKEKYNYLEV